MTADYYQDNVTLDQEKLKQLKQSHPTGSFFVICQKRFNLKEGIFTVYDRCVSVTPCLQKVFKLNQTLFCFRWGVLIVQWLRNIPHPLSPRFLSAFLLPAINLRQKCPSNPALMKQNLFAVLCKSYYYCDWLTIILCLSSPFFYPVVTSRRWWNIEDHLKFTQFFQTVFHKIPSLKFETYTKYLCKTGCFFVIQWQLFARFPTVIPARPNSLTWLLILTDAGEPILIQTETPSAETLEGTRVVLACVITTAISCQTLIYI